MFRKADLPKCGPLYAFYTIKPVFYVLLYKSLETNALEGHIWLPQLTPSMTILLGKGTQPNRRKQWKTRTQT